MADRIDQNGERLFTVRPRTRSKSEDSTIPNTRGTISSIKFNLPTTANKPKWSESVNPSVKTAFEQAVSENGFVNFIMQSISYDIQEKSQVIHTFGGEEAVYFFGRAPIMVNVSGLLIDDLDNDQFTKFLGLYQNYLRGSKASQDYCYVELSVNNARFTGAFTNIQVQQTADRDTDITFSAQFLARTFTLASTDIQFTTNDNLNTPVVRVRDPDPSITQEAITNFINANAHANLVAMLDESPTAGTAGALSLGDYTRSFGTLPTIAEATGFSASDISDFFGDTGDLLSNVTKPIQDIANQIDGYANEVIGLVEAVETGVGDLLHNIESATKSVYGAVDSLDDTVTTICNFPDSIVGKLQGFGSGGGSPLPIAGSENIDSNAASLKLSSSVPVGAARGTPEGTSASLAISRASSGASLSVKRDNSAAEDEFTPPDPDAPLVPTDPDSPTIPDTSEPSLPIIGG